VTLAARVDSFHESTDGHIGLEYKEDIEKKIDKVLNSSDEKARGPVGGVICLLDLKTEAVNA
jgi:U4/U6 small nuclear ribonucleoprotein PRP31